MAHLQQDAQNIMRTKPEEYGVVFCDAQDLILSWDLQAEKLFGWKYGEVLGENLFKLILPGEPASHPSPRLRSMHQQQSSESPVTLQVHERAVHRHGHVFPVQFIISALPGGSIFAIFIRNHEAIRQNTMALVSRAFQFEVISAILKMSLGPELLKDRLKEILAYTVNLEELDLLPMAVIFLVEQDSQTLKLNVHYGLTKEHTLACEEMAFGQCYCGRAASTNKLLYISDIPVKQCLQNRLGFPHGHYCVPFSSQGTVSGVLCLFIPTDHQQNAQTEELLHAIADIIGKIIDTRKMDLQLIDIVNDLRASIIALREEKEFSNSVIEGLQHGLITLNAKGVILKSNGIARKILHHFAPELEGRRLESIVGRENSALLLAFESNKGHNKEREITLINRNEEKLILRCSVLTRRDVESQDLGFIILLADISELYYVQREMEKMNRLSTVAEIASAVAHEVRNPLAGIKIMAQSIEEGAGSEEERLECSRRIIRQVDRLNELLTDFFSYARPVIPKKQSSSLRSILAETKPLISNKLEKQRITLVENFEEGLPPVNADPNQIQQVFLNLFLNAIDAIRQEGTITISAESLKRQELPRYIKMNHLLPQGSHFVKVTFGDNGSGMPKAAAEKVFEPFFTTKTNGSGLGMSIVYRTLKENDATISVESTEGKGTTFTMFYKTG